MNELAARDIVLLRAVETTDSERAVWSDADRAWASRAAAEVVGADAPHEDFIARRAALGIERLKGRHASIARLRRAFVWRPWVGVAIVLLAFVLGVAANQLGAGRRVNILAFPLLGLLAWNLAAYVAILASVVVRIVRRKPALGPIRALFARFAHRGGHFASERGKRGPLAPALAQYFVEWASLSMPLLRARIARILHLAAATFGLGAIGGLYLRGMVFEYRAGWESTFLDAATVHRLLEIVLAPGAALTGIAIPDAAHIASIRFGQGDNAAPWLHLYAATVAVVVLVPRTLLAIAAWASERWMATRFPLRTHDAYFQRILREFARGPTRVRVVPYSYRLPAQSESGLRAVFVRLFGEKVDLSFAAPVTYGDEDELPAEVVPANPYNVVAALFNLAATPESESHAAFVAALAARARDSASLVAIVDETSFRSRFDGQPARLAERRALWRELLATRNVVPVFVDLANPDLGTAEAALSRVLDARPH
jgi:hypothetical protein